ncbi:MAG: hypothetical protein F6K31_40000 [Symploca sp. SIO2G7]|nr:hypothetical protein [Symploca sp. SIO2G7]
MPPASKLGYPPTPSPYRQTLALSSIQWRLSPSKYLPRLARIASRTAAPNTQKMETNPQPGALFDQLYANHPAADQQGILS